MELYPLTTRTGFLLCADKRRAAFRVLSHVWSHVCGPSRGWMNCHETDSEIDEDIRERTFSPSFVSRPPQPVYVLDDRNVGMNRTNRKLKYSQAIPFVLIVFISARECYAVASLISLFSLNAAFVIDAIRDIYEVCCQLVRLRPWPYTDRLNP